MQWRNMIAMRVEDPCVIYVQRFVIQFNYTYT